MSETMTDPLAALLYEEAHGSIDPGQAEYIAVRLVSRGVTHHTITPECGPICWTTGHHHDPEACDGCRRLADMMHAAGAALAEGLNVDPDAAPLPGHQTPGEYHDYRVACAKCGEPGYLHVSWRPETYTEEADHG